jgi:hypothetical protein
MKDAAFSQARNPERSRRREEAESVIFHKNPPRYLGGYHALWDASKSKVATPLQFNDLTI